MSGAKRELLEKLKFELAFIEDGGYGRSVRTPQKATSPFQDSLTCLSSQIDGRALNFCRIEGLRYLPNPQSVRSPSRR